MLPFVVVEPLLHITRILAVAFHEGDGEFFRTHSAVFSVEHLEYPGVHGKDILAPEAEEQRAVRHLAPDAFERHQPLAQLRRGQPFPLLEVGVENSFRGGDEIGRAVPRADTDEKVLSRVGNRRRRGKCAVTAHILSEPVAHPLDDGFYSGYVIVLRNEERKDCLSGVLPQDMYPLAEVDCRRNKPFILHFQLYYIIICVEIKIFFEKLGVVADGGIPLALVAENGTVAARAKRRLPALLAIAENLPAVERRGEVEGKPRLLSASVQSA